MKAKIVPLLSVLCVPLSFAADAASTKAAPDLQAMRTEAEALSQLTQTPKYRTEDAPEATPNFKPIYYSGPDFKGKPTTVFAWLGIPEKREGKVPAVVLLHGGGGSASKDWVKHWNARGYAALSMALEGQTDNYDMKTRSFPRNPEGGPARSAIFGDSAAPIKDQWMYHCVANVGYAAALLRSLPEVDPQKVGIVGVSWGGIITATVIGIDTKYAFAIPIYGCGGLDAIPNHYGGNLTNNDVYKKVWDSHLRLEKAHMPVLWLTCLEDAQFPVDAFALSRKKKVHGPSMLSIVPGMGHGGDSAVREDCFSFADAVLKEGRPWVLQTAAKLEGENFQVTFDSTKSPESAVLVSTTDSGPAGLRKWIQTPATLSMNGDRWIAGAAIPQGSTAYFINIKAGKLTASSDYFEIKATP